MTQHEGVIVRNKERRYPFQAQCSCGWTSWGYLTSLAAESVLAGHLVEVSA